MDLYYSITTVGVWMRMLGKSTGKKLSRSSSCPPPHPQLLPEVPEGSDVTICVFHYRSQTRELSSSANATWPVSIQHNMLYNNNNILNVYMAKSVHNKYFTNFVQLYVYFPSNWDTDLYCIRFKITHEFWPFFLALVQPIGMAASSSILSHFLDIYSMGRSQLPPKWRKLH